MEVQRSTERFFCAEKPRHGSVKTLAWKDAAISTVRSVEPQSTTMISSAKGTLARLRGRLASSLSVMIATERVDGGKMQFPELCGEVHRMD